MSTRKINPLVKTAEIDALLEKCCYRHRNIAEFIGIEPSAFSLAKGGYRFLPARCVGPLAEKLGVSVDTIRELFALDENKSYVDSHV